MKKKNTFTRFLKYVKPYAHLIAIAAIGGVIKFAIPLLFPQIMQYFIDTVFSPESTMSYAQKISELNKYTLIVVGLFIFIWVPSAYVRQYFTQVAGHKVIYNLRKNLFSHIEHMSASFFSKYHSGGIVSVLMNDVSLAQNLIGNALTNIWMDGSLIVILLVIMFKMDWVLTLASLAIFPFYILISKKIGRRVKKNSHDIQAKIQSMSSDVQEKISGYSVIQAFTKEEEEMRNFDKGAKTLLNFQLISGRLATINSTLTTLLTSLAPVFVVWVGCQRILSGHLTIGQLVTFYTYLGNFYLPINRFSELNVVFSTAMAALERVFRFMDIKTDIADKPDAIECKDIKGEIEFKNISFSYDEETVINDFSLKINGGTKTALVGQSGSGKSTVANLLLRFYDVDSGSVSIDGVDIRDYSLESLRRNIGVVLQETVLFSGTVKDNILYGNPDASDEDVIEAAKSANAYEFIMDMPQGFDTILGERGTKLSGGQKQRIAIARMFIKNPKILILDEATSALDSESENLIKEALDRLLKNRTSISIAHRLSTVVNSDLIVVMEKGRIIEQGTHKELLDKHSTYSHLYNAQMQSIVL